MADVLGGVASFGTSFLDAFNKASDRDLLQAIRSGTLDVQQRTIALSELKNRQEQERQTGLGGELSGLTEALSDQLGLASQPTQDVAPQAQDISQQRTVGKPQFQRSADSITKTNKILGRLQELDSTGKAADFGFKLIELTDARKLANEKANIERNFKESVSLLRIKDPQAQERAIIQTIQDRKNAGLPSPALERILALPGERREVGLQRRKIMNTDFKLLMEGQEKELDRESKERLGFTLAPGQVRFGPAGEEIARVAATPSKPEQETTLVRNLRAAGINPKSAEGIEIIKKSLTKPRVKINLSEGLDFKLPLGFMLLDQKDPTKGVTPIPGGPKDNLTSENAAKTQMLQTARKAFKGTRSLIFDKDGSLNRTNLFNAGFNTPFTEGRKLRNRMEFGIQAITRLETGAAMPPEEVENTRTRFMPTLGDTVEIANTKLQMFEEFLNGTLKLIDPSGRFNADRFDVEFQTRIVGSGETAPVTPTQPQKKVRVKF